MIKVRYITIVTIVLSLFLPSLICFSNQSLDFLTTTTTVTLVFYLGIIYTGTNIKIVIETFLGSLKNTINTLGSLDLQYYIDPNNVQFPGIFSSENEIVTYFIAKSFFVDSNGNLSISAILLLISYIGLITSLVIVIYKKDVISLYVACGMGILQVISVILFFESLSHVEISLSGVSLNEFLPIPLSGIILVISTSILIVLVKKFDYEF